MRYNWLVYLSLTIGAAVAGYRMGTLTTDTLPHCYEDQVLIRYHVPGEWVCTNYDEVNWE